MADLLRQNILYLQRTRSLALLWHQPAPCPPLPHQWFFSSSTCPVQSQSCFYTSTALLLFQILSTEGKSQHLINLWNMQPYFNSAFIHFYWKYSTMSKISSKIKNIYIKSPKTFGKMSQGTWKWQNEYFTISLNNEHLKEKKTVVLKLWFGISSDSERGMISYFLTIMINGRWLDVEVLY